MAAARKKTAKNQRVRMDVDERRAQLVELGLQQFARTSYDELSIDAIAEMAGISKGLLYHYFPTKKAFYVACVRVATARLIALYDRAIDPAKAPLEQLADDLDRYLEYVKSHGQAYGALMRNGVGIDPEVRSAVDETRETLVARLKAGMGTTLPDATLLEGPLLDLSLRGWVGLAERISIEWVDATLDAPKQAPTQDQVRAILIAALGAIVQGALSSR